ncbi:uncharacterized protein [Rutidosis leptorrhynchoides]|uniref:uncharacterized protein n=1 Tax=Rutidosis leptorrhynchoides TaxID=125765 RepID=UPI003A99592E
MKIGLNVPKKVMHRAIGVEVIKKVQKLMKIGLIVPPNKVKPRKGDALLFFSLHPNGTIDALNLHGSCPVSLKARNGVRQNGFMSGTLTSPTTQVTIAKMKMSTARHGLRLV